jgi:hypothetical protein
MRFLLIAILALKAFAAPPEALATKIFPTLAILASNPEIRRLNLEKDAASKWTEDQIATVASKLRDLYTQNSSVRQLADHTFRPSHLSELNAKHLAADFLPAVFREAAQGMNRIIDVYQFGQAPRYPAIDAPSYDVKSPTYLRMIEIGKRIVAAESRPDDAFFSASLRYAILLLELNRRDEAVRFEPMELGENRPAADRALTVAKDPYPYSAIVVPGAGSDRPGVPLSPYGKLRLRVAAARYHAKQAPFLIVSGGYVHPNQTPFNEAFEMKKSLVEDFSVPAEAIFIDPHARHTTTNLRNAARLIHRHHLGFDKPALIVTDPGQSAYIENPNFIKRCQDEMRLVPFRNLKRKNEFDLEFLPTLDSLHIDPLDPLDP